MEESKNSKIQIIGILVKEKQKNGGIEIVEEIVDIYFIKYNCILGLSRLMVCEVYLKKAVKKRNWNIFLLSETGDVSTSKRD